ncbi:hypothetical protein ABZU92_01220 [Micromonospora arida]|uniref:hypothetical protein n=1 Tax=Micromonospora arida TaxID=2203715 RepID=UPI0033B76E34
MTAVVQRGARDPARPATRSGVGPPLRVSPQGFGAPQGGNLYRAISDEQFAGGSTWSRP